MDNNCKEFIKKLKKLLEDHDMAIVTYTEHTAIGDFVELAFEHQDKLVKTPDDNYGVISASNLPEV